MKKKSGFSMIELLAIIMIIGILFISLKPLFTTQNQRIIGGMTCITTLHGLLNNYLQETLMGKNISSGTTILSPDIYTISTDQKSQTILLGFQSQNQTGTYKEFSLIHGERIDSHCNGSNYSIFFSGIDYTITVQPQQTDSPQIQIQNKFNTFLSTGTLDFYTCNPNQTNCQLLAFINFDLRKSFFEFIKCTEQNDGCKTP